MIQIQVDPICIPHFHTWKKPMSPLVGHFVAIVATPKYWVFLHSNFCRRPNFWAFLCSFARCRLKNWISVGDPITGSPGFFYVCSLLYLLISVKSLISLLCKGNNNIRPNFNTSLISINSREIYVCTFYFLEAYMKKVHATVSDSFFYVHLHHSK